ncbi:MAG: hypothetical protein CME98_19980 [Hyphomonas sp.]|nr:hypothetical protein [Hyphomonas sp.]
MLGHHKQEVEAMELLVQLLVHPLHFLPEAEQVLQVQDQVEMQELTALELGVIAHQQMVGMDVLIEATEQEVEALLLQTIRMHLEALVALELLY